MNHLLRIPPYEILFEVARSQGPGGQNVNRTNSAVVIRWNVLSSIAFNESEKRKILERLKTRITVEGDLLIRSEEFRDQPANRKRGLEKMASLLSSALFEPKKRKATKPTFASKRKRLESKKNRSDKKKSRSRVDY